MSINLIFTSFLLIVPGVHLYWNIVNCTSIFQMERCQYLHRLDSNFRHYLIHLSFLLYWIQLLYASFSSVSSCFALHWILHCIQDISHFRGLVGAFCAGGSDEITEAMHSQIRLFEDAHRYINNQKGSSSHARMQHRSTVHLNSVNIGEF